MKSTNPYTPLTPGLRDTAAISRELRISRNQVSDFSANYVGFSDVTGILCAT
ncbi:hypothetical protein BABINDRAFT_160869 [Babjeviella inositovora NRRL Y-12698]|uniref:Uncharacterized protein n=1 Tax=Babjeviella inositovora NRRL Y-12698 TaxID=984486 RepID=A0A1E3QSE8_9ASCO|nr:uncharacterized protein BABINDRAFT_160869 [Babjeviella inositovora NRRL Y-12698]ODQ80611.1 hypothetical protein BABINDRAFT_160869 [Babjeviella inositovora NRRL Y-12698]